MSAYINANGLLVTELNLSIAYYGIPVADVTLASSDVLVSPITLTVGNLLLAMAIGALPDGSPAQRTFAGQTTTRLVGGAGGWRRPVALNPYRAPPGTPGVLLSRVLSDTAGACGEKVAIASGQDRAIGPTFCPEPQIPASRILSLLAGALWWVDTSGVTQVASARPASSIASFATVEDVHGGKGWVRIATEDPASWIPGASYAGPMQSFSISATRIHSGKDGVSRIEVLTQ